MPVLFSNPEDRFSRVEAHFILDKLEIPIYLSLDKFKANTILYFIFDDYYKLVLCLENSMDPDQLASSEAS